MKLVVLPLFLAATGIVWLASAALRPAPVAPLPFGPGAVVELHRELFAALDAGDEAKAVALLDTTTEGGWAEGADGGLARPTLQLLDERGLPVSAQGPDAARTLLAATARASKDGGPAWSTKIVKLRADCPSGDISYAVLEFERTRGEKGATQRYRSTALVRWTDGRMKLFHWHVSPADEATAKLASASEAKKR